MSDGTKFKRIVPPGRATYPGLDGLRGVAFLMVFFYHFASFPWGWAGVNIFFVLSGFLITGILVDSRDNPRRIHDFYIRRVLRIFPLFYGVFLVILLLNPIAHWNLSIYWIAWPLYLANFLPFFSKSILVNGSPIQIAAYAWLIPKEAPKITLYLGHFWTLCVEEQFYLLWPWIVFRARRNALIVMCTALVIVVPLVRSIGQQVFPVWMLNADLLNRATPFQLDSLLLGGLIALLLRGPNRERLFQIARIVTICFFAVAVLIAMQGVVASYPNWQTGYIYPAWKFTWGLTLINFLAAGMILVLVRGSGLFCRVLSVKPMRWIGQISYGAYVFHDIFHAFIAAAASVLAAHSALIADHLTFFTCFIGLGATLFISWISFKGFEVRFLKLKDKFCAQPYRLDSPTAVGD